MSGRWFRRTGVVAVLVVVATVVTSGGDLLRRGGWDANAGPGATTVAASKDDEHAKQLERDLDRLSESWALGGGRFGYPFWEKAGQRWRTGQVTTPLYREYATGYRDRLRAGCDLIEATDVNEAEAKDVRSLLVDSCRSRLKALAAQRSWLDVLIHRDHLTTDESTDATAAATGDPAAARQELARQRTELDADAAEHEADFREALQDSYRDARLAMDLAQSELDSVGRDRLPEGAFM